MKSASGVALSDKVSRFLSRWRVRKVRGYIGNSVLDVGCGKGPVIPCLAPGAYYTGIDRDPFWVERLSKEYPQYEFQVVDLDKGFPAMEPIYDTVLLLAVIEHLEDPRSVLKHCYDCLQPGGRMIITVPTAWGERLHRFFERLRITNPGVKDEHLRCYDAASLRDLVAPLHGTPERFQKFQFYCNQLLVFRKAVE